MHKNTLVAGKRYRGLYVALKSFHENTVIASGKEPAGVVKRAHLKGIENPVLVYVPEKNFSHVY